MSLSWDSDCVETRNAMRRMQSALWGVPDELFTMSGGEVLSMEKSRNPLPLAIRHKALTKKDQGILLAKLNNRRHVLCAKQRDAVASCILHAASHVCECCCRLQRRAPSPTCDAPASCAYPTCTHTCTCAMQLREARPAGAYPAAEGDDIGARNSAGVLGPVHLPSGEYRQVHFAQTQCGGAKQCSMQHTAPACHCTSHTAPIGARRKAPDPRPQKSRKEEDRRRDCACIPQILHSDCPKRVWVAAQQPLKPSLQVATPMRTPPDASQRSARCRLGKKNLPLPHSPKCLNSPDPRRHGSAQPAAPASRVPPSGVCPTLSQPQATADLSPQPEQASANVTIEPQASLNGIQQSQQQCLRASHRPHSNTDFDGAAGKMATRNTPLSKAAASSCESSHNRTVAVSLSPMRHPGVQPELFSVNDSALATSPTRRSRVQSPPQPLPAADFANASLMPSIPRSRVQHRPPQVGSTAHIHKTAMSPAQHSRLDSRRLPPDGYSHTTTASAVPPNATTRTVLPLPLRATSLPSLVCHTAAPPLLHDKGLERDGLARTVDGASGRHCPLLAPPDLARCGVIDGRLSGGYCAIEEHGGQAKDVPKSTKI